MTMNKLLVFILCLICISFSQSDMIDTNYTVTDTITQKVYDINQKLEEMIKIMNPENLPLDTTSIND
jgi:hypothetical protein